MGVLFRSPKPSPSSSQSRETVGPRTGDEGCPSLATPCPPFRYELARSATCSFCGPGGGDLGDRRRSPKLAPEMWGLTPGHFAIPFLARAPLKIRTCSLSRRAASFARLLKASLGASLSITSSDFSLERQRCSSVLNSSLRSRASRPYSACSQRLRPRSAEHTSELQP